MSIVAFCENGDLIGLRGLLESPDFFPGAVVNPFMVEIGFYYACKEGHAEIVRYLLKLEGPLALRDSGAVKPGLTQSIKHGHVEVSRILLTEPTWLIKDDVQCFLGAELNKSIRRNDSEFACHVLENFREFITMLGMEHYVTMACDRQNVEIASLMFEDPCLLLNEPGQRSELFRRACFRESEPIIRLLLNIGLDRLPDREVFDEFAPSLEKFYGITWDLVMWNNKPRAARLFSWKHSRDAHFDARLVFAQARIGRPMELRRRLWLGRFAGGLTILGELNGQMVSPRDAAAQRGNEDCVAVIDEFEQMM